ncbi:MAG: ABC transporter substrate-binding protein [Acidimicrobiales bacterium]
MASTTTALAEGASAGGTESATTAPPTTDDLDAVDSEPLFAEDPFGGIFADYQASFDRSTDPFSSLDSFCQEHPAAENRTASMRGVSEDTIQLGHLRNALEELAGIGFGVEVGNVAEMFEFMVQALNDCGGVRGRTVELATADSSPLAADTVASLTAACLELTEDVESAFIMNSSGFQGSSVLCVTEEHETPLITTQGLPQEFYDRSDGILITMDIPIATGLKNLVLKADADGMLEGKTIGVVYPDTPGIPPDMIAGVSDVLVGLGYEVAVEDEIGCGGATSCVDGVQDSVARMKAAGVDALFPGLNILSLPGYVSEMVTQGYEPGDVQFFNSSLNSQNADLVSSKVVAFGGEAAGELYNGTYIVDAANTGVHSTDGAFVPPINQLCMDTYEAQGGQAYDYFSTGGNTPRGMLTLICVQVRLMARIVYHAGDNPTLESVKAAIAGLGAIDTEHMVPGSINGQKGVDDMVQDLRWTFPCEFGPDRAFDDKNTCVVPTGNYVPLVR